MFFSVFWRYILSYSKKYKLFNVGSFGDIFSQKIAFIGINDKTLSVINKMENHPYGKRIVGYFDFKNHDIGFSYLGNLEKISNIVFEKGINEIIINEPNISKYDVLRLLPSLSKTSSILKIIPETDNEINEQIEMVGLTEWIGSTNNDIAEVLRNGREMYYNESEGYAAMKDHSHKHPNTISVHESQRGRSDYVRFADRLGVVSLDFGAITGGYDCYHAECDTLDEMIAWMGTDNATGTENVVASFDMISWWQFSLFLYLDERPVYDGS